MTRQKKYIIFATTNGKSAGQRVLYQLRAALAQYGFDAKIFCYGKRVGDDAIFVNSLKDYDKNEDIIVYTEIIDGNPLGFKNVVRYILQDPKFWGMSDAFDKREMLFAFDDICYKNVPYLRFDTIDRNLFYNAHTPKDVNCYFVYKRGKFREVPEIEGWTEINMHWPESREELAKLLQRTEYLYSYDDRSSILPEAELCGAKVKIITDDDIIDYTRGDEFNTDKLEQQLRFFINETQNMKTSQNINKEGYYSYFDYLWNKFYRFALRIIYLITHSKKIKLKLKNCRLIKAHSIIYKYKDKIYDV